MKGASIILLSVGLLLAAILAYGQQRPNTLVFRDVDVFDGTRMIRHTNVVVRDGMIRGVGADLVAPGPAQAIDGKGKTLLPGLFDSHTHLGTTNGEVFLRDALKFGVTTELEMWGSSESVALRNRIAADGSLDLSDLRTAATGITVPHGHPTQMGGPDIPTLGPNDDVQAFVDARIAEGADYIKVIYEPRFPTLTRAQIEDVIAAVHRRNKLVVVHVTRQAEAREVIAAGADGLAHIFTDSPPQPGFAELAAQHHVFVIPTLALFEAIAVPEARRWWQQSAGLAPFISPSMRQTLDMKFPPGFGGKEALANAEAAVAALHHAGVRLLAGTDAPAPGMAHGLSLHRDMELLVQSGLTPLEALAAATSEPARTFGFYDRGRIAVGLRADLLLVNGDPSANIAACRDIAGIWKLGLARRRDSSDH